MQKMTSKEAFNKLQHYINGTELSGKEYLECCKIIDKDLERLEKMEKTIKILNKYYEFNIFSPTMDNIAEISISTDWSHYITQQEYELLKEVLGK